MKVTSGSHLNKFDSAGNLIKLSVEEMAENAFYITQKGWFCPVVCWVKDFKGQVTNGRIGRPTYSYSPVSWLGSSAAAEVVKLAEAQKATGG